ncbi:hypothetical protein OESDEN_19081 [Oesophagostomum dentatum]|uniref:Uncharacterized protein n=1 Tax=Oesophagostomum dentatum TaxID=61180 RepID=A0A0B1S7G0_OESDE|nr:hypothetical protein OESDEN_19081 [Oesophagostomum dentatum]
MSELVNVSLQDSILYIGINRPEKKNCVNHETAMKLVAAFNRFNNDKEVKIGILYGEGEQLLTVRRFATVFFSISLNL